MAEISISKEFRQRTDKTQTFTSFKAEKDAASKAKAKASQAKVFIPTAQKIKADADISSDVKEGIEDINLVTKANPKGERVIHEQEKTKAAEVKKKADLSIKENRETLEKRNVQRVEDEFEGTQFEDKDVRKAVLAGRANAISKDISSKVGEAPTPPDTTDMSPDEISDSQLKYQTQLTDYYKRLGEETQSQLGDVSSQVQSFGDQMKQYQGAIDSLVSNLNNVNPGAGTALSEVMSELNQTGNGNLTPEAISKIQVLGESGLNKNQFKSQARAILASTVSPGNLHAAGVSDNGDSYTLSNGVTFDKGANGKADLSVNNLPQDANSFDIALMQLATDNSIANTALGNELELLQDMSESVRRQTEVARVEIDNTFDTASNRVDEQLLATTNEIKYRERKLSLERDTSLKNILNEEAKMEGYMRGQLEAWGADSSTAGLAVMGTIKAKFVSQAAQTKSGYDIELARMADLEIEARLAYTNRSIEIANQKATSLGKVNNVLLDSIDKIFTGTSQAYNNRDLKFLKNNTDYFKDRQAILTAASEAEAEAFKDTRDFNFKLMKEYADQSGIQYEMLDDGSIAMVLNDDGTPALTTKGSKSKGNGDSSGDFSPGGIDAETTEDRGGFLNSIQATTSIGAGRTGKRLITTGNSDVDENLKQIQAGTLSIDDFPTSGGNAKERATNKLTKQAYNAQIDAFVVVSKAKKRIFSIFDSAGADQTTKNIALKNLEKSEVGKDLIESGENLSQLLDEYYESL